MISADRRTRRLALPAVLAALAAPLASVPAAQAEGATGRQVVYSHVDARRDAYGRTDYDDGSSSVTTRGVGEDLGRLTIVSDGTTLQANITTRVDTVEDFQAWVRITTAAGRTYHVGYVLTTDTLDDYFRIVRKGSRTTSCDGGRAYRVEAGVVVRVPLACLGDPTQIRAGAETWGIYPTSEGGVRGETISYDDALRTGPSAAARSTSRINLAGRGYATMSGSFAVR